jgi:hypothetical protein
MMRDDALRQRWGWIVQRIAGGIFVSGPQLARSLDEAPGAPLPPLVARYLAALLRDEVKSKTGRRPASDAEAAILGLADRDYRWFLNHIQRMRRRQNSIFTARWVREAEWFRQAPADLAIVMVKHRYYDKLTEEAVKAMLSRYRNGHRQGAKTKNIRATDSLAAP